MKKRIQFYVDEERYKEAEQTAQDKGLTLDNMARTAFFAYLTRYSIKRQGDENKLTEKSGY